MPRSPKIALLLTVKEIRECLDGLAANLDHHDTFMKPNRLKFIDKLEDKLTAEIERELRYAKERKKRRERRRIYGV